MTFDDTSSLGDKAAYAKSQGMAGCFTWALDEVYIHFRPFCAFCIVLTSLLIG